MQYDNPQIPEGINYSREHPLKEFFWLFAAVVLSLGLLIALLAFSAEKLARFVPFSVEQELVETYWPEVKNEDPGAADQKAVRVEGYLQALSNQLALAQQLPPDMAIQVHYRDDDTVNAFAFLGGHILIHRGLLDALQSENALAMVLAHEIAHVANRDPIVAMSRGLTVVVALSVLVGAADNALLGSLLQQTGTVTSLSFNRRQEARADKDALSTLQRYYGHVGGAADLFDVLAKAETLGGLTPEVLNTHPLTRKRIERIEQFQQRHPSRKPGTELTPLPAW